MLEEPHSMTDTASSAVEMPKPVEFEKSGSFIVGLAEVQGTAGDPQAGAMLTEDMLHEQELEVAERDVTDLLRNVFDSMAPNGKITMDQLPFVLVGAEVQATAKEIEDAIEEHFPDADDPDALLDFEQVEALYRQLMHNALEVLSVHGMEEQAVKSPALWKRLWWWLQARRRQQKAKATAYEKHMKPTTRLLILILCTSCLVSAAVVLFAVMFIWNHSTNTVQEHLVRDAQLMRDGLNLFGYTHPFEAYDFNQARLASLLSKVVEDLGYQGTKKTMKKNLAYQQSLMAKLLDGWFENDSLNTVASTAVLVKSWIEHILRVRPEATVLNMIDSLNPRMPSGHEILLGRWSDGSKTEITFLTAFRYGGQCLNGVCMSDKSAALPMKAALANSTGTMIGNDYRPQRCLTAYTFIAGTDLGLMYQVDVATFQEDFVEPVTVVIDEINIKTTQTEASALAAGTRRESSQEVTLAKETNGETQILTALRQCDAKCMQTADIQGSAITHALRGETGVNETSDFNGEEIITSYGPMPSAGLGLVIKMATEELVDNLYVSLGESLDVVNTMMLETQEIQLASAKKNSTTATTSTLEFHTAFKFNETCKGKCGTAFNSSLYLWKAINGCEEGLMRGLDYRGEMVTAGYACVPSLKCALATKVDHAQIYGEGIALAGTIASYQSNNRYANKTTEIIVGKKKAGVSEVQSARDFESITEFKHRTDCYNMTCTGKAVQMARALAKESGVGKGLDYRNVPVIGAYTYIDSLELGVVLQVDLQEAESQSLVLTLQLCGCTVSAVIVSMIVLAVLSNVLLKSMDHAWEEGKRAIEREKQQYCSVIQAMYPAQVAKRLLDGETQIVYNVGNATVFFSDIYEFTTTSNAISPEELIQFLGYTFGVMDAIAEYHHIYKVKTIGDAYLAVSGLPGMDPLHGNNTLDMLLFASSCVQVFSNRYTHPEDGVILDAVVKTLMGKKKAAKAAEGPATHIPKRPSLITYGPAPTPNPEKNENGLPLVHCIMRYGVAAGSITAGVLQGKTPQFDIWGKTVNLASRMESTGQPGRIQVSEGVYQVITGLKGQPFTFETRHKVFCKGFGNVSAYFVDACHIAPPRELLASLHIEPNVGQFFFSNPIPGFRSLVRGPNSSHHESGHGSSMDQQSCQSSVVSGPHIRTEATLQA